MQNEANEAGSCSVCQRKVTRSSKVAWTHCIATKSDSRKWEGHTSPAASSYSPRRNALNISSPALDQRYEPG